VKYETEGSWLNQAYLKTAVKVVVMMVSFTSYVILSRGLFTHCAHFWNVVVKHIQLHLDNM